MSAGLEEDTEPSLSGSTSPQPLQQESASCYSSLIYKKVAKLVHSSTTSKIHTKYNTVAQLPVVKGTPRRQPILTRCIPVPFDLITMNDL